MDLLDKLDNLFDAFGVPKEGETKMEMAERKLDTFRKTAKFLAVITDKEEREEQILNALQQAHRAGVEGK